MNSTVISIVIFVCVFSFALLGIYMRTHVPESHLKDDTLSIVKLATGLIATMSALVLGLLISSAKGSFDRINNELTDNAARVLTLDHMLGSFGPETRELRELLKRSYALNVAILTSGDPGQLARLDSPESTNAIETLRTRLMTLAPKNETQEALRTRMVQISNDITSTRALVFLQKEGTIPMPMLAMLAAWLSIIFAAFGLCAPRNHTTIAALFVCSLCAAGAIFLILEMDRPLDGWISLRGGALNTAVQHLGK